MLQLAVAAPGGRRVELEVAEGATFVEVKQLLEHEFGVPIDKQRLLCNGKERRDAAETLASAGLLPGPSHRLMLLLVPGFTLPPLAKPTGDAAEAAPSASCRDLRTTLPATAVAVSGSDCPPAYVHVVSLRGLRWTRCRVTVLQGLDRATFSDLAEHVVSSECLNLADAGVLARELQFLRRGKAVKAADPLGPRGVQDISVLVIFPRGYKAASWLANADVELRELEGELARLGKRVNSNVADGAEAAVLLASLGAAVDGLCSGHDELGVGEAVLPEAGVLRERLGVALSTMSSIKSQLR